MAFSAALCAINAKYIHSSLAPWCLAAGVEAYAPELTVRVVEGTINEPPEAVLERVCAGAPDAVTFSCYLWNIEETLALAARVKQRLPGVTVALGGPEVSYNAADVLRENSQIDYILSGEGEQSVPAFLRCLAAGRDPLEADIPGLCGRKGETVTESAPCVLPGDVPSPYTPAYLSALNGRIAYLETSRGCPYSCAFCLSGRCGKPRWFGLDRAFRDILTLANSGAKTVKFIDRTFNADPRHANAILEFILNHYGRDIPAGVCFHFEIAGDILKEETFRLLERMPLGAVQLEIGMQSFCERTLEAVRRKTDTDVLKRNIRRLVAMGNMHIHIDLIAGLPFEDLPTFAQSFDEGYALGASMLQLGFLKLLHGAAMREETDVYPCAFSKTPPYEVQSTPWLSEEDLALLHKTEDALERVYNSRRFRGTAAYVLEASGLRPFAFYTALGKAAGDTARLDLDGYTARLYEFCKTLPGVDADLLRDAMVCDRLSTNATGRLPACLQVKDPLLAKAVRALAQDSATAPKPGVRRGVAVLYGARQIAFVDYTQKNPVTAAYVLHRVPIDNLSDRC